MFGSHLSIAGGLHNALREAKALGMDCVQLFTRNQRQWNGSPLSEQELAEWRRHRRLARLEEVVCHGSYLVNLASPDPAAWEKALGLFRQELLRCEALGIRRLVVHPGSHMGAGEQAGLVRVVEALDRLHRELPGLKVVTCLELTAGQGSSLGWRLEQLRCVLDSAAQPERLAVCLDTAHMLAAGYRLTSGPGAQAVIQEVQAVVGLSRVAVIHVNDSKVARGRRVDRHEHIGHGHIPLSAFRAIITHPSFARVPKIIETPKQTAPDGRTWDAINIETLRRLVGRGRG